MPFPSLRTVAGIGKETTKGTGVAATSFIAFKKFDTVDNIALLMDAGIRASMGLDFDTILGPSASGLDLSGDVFPDTIGFPLQGLLGDVTVTGGSAPYTHAMALLNSGTGQPTSYTISDYDPLSSRRFAGMQFHDLALKFDAAGLFEYDAKATGWASGTAGNPSQALSTDTPTAAWNIAVVIGGSTVTYVTTFECQLQRKLKVLRGASGSQNPYAIFLGDLTVTGKMKVFMEDETQLLNYINNSKPSLDVSFTTGAGAGTRQVKLHSSKTAFKLAKRDRSAEEVALDIDFTCLLNTTDAGASGGYSPIKATLQNAMASGTYA